MYDTIIIGAGPAGLTAGIFASRRKMKTLIISKDIGGQVLLANEIENYPGFEKIKGGDLIEKMKAQVVKLGVKIENGEISEIKRTENKNFLVYSNGKEYETKTVIIAMGLSHRRLSIPGEKELSGRGVSYCVNCDGFFFKEKTVAVVGGGNSALDAAEVLSKIASKVYLIYRGDKFKGFETLINEVRERRNVELMLDSEIEEIVGSQKVEKIKVFNNKTEEKTEVGLDGVFVEVGRVANTDLLADLVKRNDRGEVLVDEKCATSSEGIFATEGTFAAGDVTQVPFKQITIACGQGTIAALAAYQYIQLKLGNKTATVIDRGSVAA